MEEGIAMAGNAQERNIQVWEDRAKVTRDERQGKDSDSPSSVCLAVGPYGHVPHEQNNPYQTVLSSISALLPEDFQHTPIYQECETKSSSKRDYDLLPLGFVYSVHRIPSQYRNDRHAGPTAQGDKTSANRRCLERLVRHPKP
jgi:hypothetical protein